MLWYDVSYVKLTLRIGQMGGSTECGDKPSGSINP